MNIEYRVRENGPSGPQVVLSIGGQFIGTIWGEVDGPQDGFESEHGIIGIKHNDEMIAVIWGTKESE